MKGEVYLIWLVFFWFISLPTVLFYWWKRRKARISAGENYFQDANYQKYVRRKNYSDIACVGLFLITTLFGLFIQRQMTGLVIFWSLCLWSGSVVAFIIFWWKKRQARLSAGENYFEDLTYQKISKYKRIIGVASVAIFIFLTQVTRNPDLLLTSAEIEDLKIQAQQEREKFISELEGEEKNFYEIKFAEYISEGKEESSAKFSAVQDVKNKRINDKKIAEEKLASEKKAEEEKLAAEKKAAEEKLAAEKKAEEEKLAAEKKAEEEKLAAEKKAEEEKLASEKKAEEEKLAATQENELNNSETNQNSVIGLFSKIKSGLEDIAEVEFGELTSEEIFVGSESNGFKSYDFYILPETVRPLIDGIIFETREGYIMRV